MTARCFADTNLLLYAASKDPADETKQHRARTLLSEEDVGFSVQVLQEFAHNALAKQRLGLQPGETEAIIQALLEYPVLPLTGDLVLDALQLQQHYRISYWDAAIIAAARELGCEILYTEDLNDGQDYGGVIARNPFAQA